MQDTTVNNLKLTIFDIEKLPNLPFNPTYKDVKILGTIYTTRQGTLLKEKFITLIYYKGVVYKDKGDWSEGRDISFYFRSIDCIVIAFDTIEDFQKIVEALNNLNDCLKEIAEFTEKTLREKLNTNPIP